MRSPRYTASGAGHASPKRNEACLLPPIATTTTTRLDNLVSASVASPWRCAAPTLLHQHPPKSSRSTSSHNSIGSFGTPTRRSEEGRSKSKQSAKVNSSGRQNPVNAPATYYYNSSDLAKKSQQHQSSKEKSPTNRAWSPSSNSASSRSASSNTPVRTLQNSAVDAEQSCHRSPRGNHHHHHRSHLSKDQSAGETEHPSGVTDKSRSSSRNKDKFVSPPSSVNNEAHYRESDRSTQELLRAFLAERKGNNSTCPESLPLKAFTSSSRNSLTTPAPAAKANAKMEPYMGLTAEEMQELFIVLQNLHHFLPAHTQQQERASPTAEAPFTPTPSSNAEKDEVTPRHDAAPANVAPLSGKNERNVNPPAAAGAEGSVVSGTPAAAGAEGSVVSGTPAAAAKKNRVRFTSEVVESNTRDVSRKQSVEGRYKEALKTIESAAGDCQVALQRVKDYSASLYTLVETWMHLHDNRFDEFARAVLQRMLDENPSYQALFYNVDISTQSLVIMDMIGRAVVAFTRPADLMDIMGEMGARHNLYGLKEEQFVSMRDAFLEVYEEFVGAETYKRSVGVWKMFWKTTIELAVSGSNSERGKIYTQRRNVVWAERLKKIFNRLVPLQCKGGFHQLMQAMYPKALARFPQAKNFVRMTEKRTAHRMMEVIIRIVKSIVENGVPDKIEYNDQFSVANLHTDKVHDYDERIIMKFEEPFLEACESFLAPVGAWNIQVRSILQELWSTYITGYLTARPPEEKAKGKGATAPDGKDPFCLMFTDIEASTRLWAADAQSMGTAVTRHHKLIRGLIEDFEGYEVKTVGDSFLIATRTVTQALLIAFGIQLELMMEASGPNFHMVENPQGTGDASCWRDDALRVRVGIHYCTDATAVYDSVHSRFDYYGPSVNCAARVEAAACGGQTLLSSDAYKRLQAEEAFSKLPVSSLLVEELGKLVQAQEARGVSITDPQLAALSVTVQQAELGMESTQSNARRSVGALTTMAALTHVEDFGCQTLKGIAEPVQLYSLLPPGLTGRVFRKDSALNMTASRGTLFGSAHSTDMERLASSPDDGLLDSSVTNSTGFVTFENRDKKLLSFTSKSNPLETTTS